MGIEKQTITGRFSPENVRHIDDLCFAQWPNLSRSAALNLIVEEHRLLMAAGILTRAIESWQQRHCVTAEEILGLDPKRVGKGENGKGNEKDCTREKSA